MTSIKRIILALAAAFILPVSAKEMYYNRLSAGEEVIPAGEYGDIVVPEGGYKATKFGSSLGTISQATDDWGGSYTAIIDTFLVGEVKNGDLADHTVSGWFMVPKDASGETTLWVEKTSNTSSNHRGNAVKVSKDGHLIVGKIKSSDGWQGSDSHITSTDTVTLGEWFYLTINFTVTHGTTRKATAKAYVNGAAFDLPTTAFACNYNGYTCAAIKVGNEAACAGFRVDDAVIDDLATIKAWATNERYVVQPPSDDSIWTGAAGDGDPTNAENWDGGKVPNKRSVVKMGGAIYLNAVEGQTFAANSILFTNDVTLTGTCDWSALPAAPDMGEYALDMNGNGLTLTKLMVGTVTNAATDVATLTFNVAEGETIQNTAMSIQGNIQFVKEGAGTFDGRVANQKYTGGTVVNEGAITSNESETKLHWGASGSEVLVEPNGVLDVKNNLSWCLHKIILNGGVISNATTTTSGVAQGIGDIELRADSKMIAKYHTTFSDNRSGYVGVINLGGHTLEFVQISNPSDDKAIMYVNNAVISNGTLVIGRKIKFNPRKATCMGENVTLDMQGDFYMFGADITVENLIDGSKGDTQTLTDGGRVCVTGRYTPQSECLVNVTLKSGATLDLNGQEDAWTFGNYLTPQTIVYEDGATITVDVSEREVQDGDKLIAWEEKPENVVFVPDETTAGKELGVVIKADGLYCSAGAIVTAHWTNAAEDNDFNNADNWACTNAAGEYVEGELPGDATTVYFTGDKIPDIEEPVEWLAISVNGSLSTDRNWMGLGETPIVAGSFVDVNGHNLTLAKVFDGTVTNSTEDVENPGLLTLVVAEDTAVTNATLALQGNLRFVKEGEGTYIGTLQNQTYTGGTLIREGTILAANYEKFHCLGAEGTDITIDGGATLDSNGWYDWVCHRIVLNGGTLMNRGGSMTQAGWSGFGDIVLTEDSRMALSYHASFNDNNVARYVDLGGHTLEIEYLSDKGDGKAILYALHTTWMNGTIVMGPDIMLRPYSYTTFSNDLTIVCNGDLELTKANMTIGSLTDNSEGLHEGYGYSLTINGTYKPVSTNLHSTVMADGSTLDLSEQTETWAFTCKEGKDQTLTFAPGGTIAIDVSGRELAEGDQIIAWDAKPNATFTFAGYEGGLRAFAEADGLYARTTSTEVDKGYWTGAADDGDPMNPQNWACTNAVGEEVTGAIPTNAAASVVIRNLTTDLDWTKLGTVNFAAGEVDLAGHTLTLAAFAETSAAIITNTVEAIGTVKVDIGEGYSSTLGGSTICGNIALDILSGTFQLTSSTGITGGNPNLVTVGGGATLDENSVIDTPLALLLEDGATLTNTGAGQGYTRAQFTGGLTLAEGATAYIDTDHQMAFTAKDYATMPISIGSGTLVKKGTGKLSIQNGSITGTGSIRVEAGELNLGNKGLAIDDTITVELQDNTEVSTYLWVEVTCSIPNLAGNGRVAASSASLTVTKCYSGLLQIGQQGGSNPFTNGTLTLGDGATLDLTEVEGTWTEHAKVVFGENATVKVDLTGRTVEEGDKVIAWSAKPPESAKILAKGADVYFVRKDDGLYAAKSFMIFVR